MSDTPLHDAPVLTVRRSKTIFALFAALSLAQDKFTAVAKSGYDVDNARSFSELSDLIKATRPALTSNGLAVMQFPSTCFEHRTATITTLLTHKSGQWIENDLELPVRDEKREDPDAFEPRTIAASITLGRRYAYASILQLAAEPENTTIQDMATLRNESPRVNPAQAQLFWKKALASGKTREQVNGYLLSVGIEVTERMTQKQLPFAMQWAEKKEEAGQ
jgi:hypothetical protein